MHPEIIESDANHSLVTCGTSPDGHDTLEAADHLNLSLLPDQAGMVGYLAPKYVLADRGLFFVNGAFRKTAEEQLSRAHHLYNHWSDLAIGKHVVAEEDKKGFKVQVQINEGKQLGADVMSDYRFGIPYGWSYGFDAVRDRSGTEEDNKKLDRSGAPHLANTPITELRAITETRWWEGSTVTWGAIHNAGPDVIQRRGNLSRADLHLLLAAIKDGTLTDEQTGLMEQLVTAWTSRAVAGSPLGIDHDTRNDEGESKRRSDLAAAMSRYADLISREIAA